MQTDDQYHQMRMNGMSPSGLPIPEPDRDEISRKTDIARAAILEELKRRFKAGDIGVSPLSERNRHRWFMPQANYFSGGGDMKCPICSIGTLAYSRSDYNGHVMGSCSTNNCVNWRE